MIIPPESFAKNVEKNIEIENNLVRPYAFSKLLNIHPIMGFTFLYIGAKYFGVIGALFAPAFAAASCVLIEELYMKNIE